MKYDDAINMAACKCVQELSWNSVSGRDSRE